MPSSLEIFPSAYFSSTSAIRPSGSATSELISPLMKYFARNCSTSSESLRSFLESSSRISSADSGTVPALLILELLSKKERKLSELVEQFRAKYFISGEINSEVDDSEAKMAEIEAKYSDGTISK